MDIIAQVREDMLASIERRISTVEADAKDILRKGVNQTAKQALNDLSKEAAAAYVAKGGARQYKRASKIKNATKSRPTATINFKGSMREIKDYKASPLRVSVGKNRPKLTKGKVLKNTKLTPLVKDKLKAFTVQFKSKHIAVVQRNPSKMMRSNPKKQSLRVLLSPSIPQAIGNRTYSKVQSSIGTNLEENLNKFISSTLGGL